MGFEYSCVMALCPEDLHEDLSDFARKLVKEEESYVDPENPDWVPSNMHVTALYGIQEADCDERVLKVTKACTPLSFTISGVGFFSVKDRPFDVIKLNVKSESMARYNAALREEFPDNKNSFPEYVPHVTLAYVKKGTVPQILQRLKGLPDLELEVPVSRIEVSRNDGQHHFYEV